MSCCPSCGHILTAESNRCQKCGATLPVESKRGASQCSKCGGTLKAEHTNCPWCGFPCDLSTDAKSERSYSEISADMNIPYSVLSIKCSEAAPEILQIDLSIGRIGDVVRPKPIHGEISLPRDQRMAIEEEIRELLQVFAKSGVGRAIAGERVLSHFVKGVGQVLYSSFVPDSLKESLRVLNDGSLLALALDDSVLGLPWELAYDGSEFLCTRFGVGRIIYSGKASLKKRKPRRETRVLLISDPDNSLPHTIEKVGLPLKEKLERLGVEVVHMRYAPGSPYHTSKGNIREAFGSGSYDIIHFMGHGRYDPRSPGESCFALADGEHLSAKEISTLLDYAVRYGKDAPFLFYALSCEAGAQRGWDMRAYESQVLGLSEAFIRHNVAYVGAFWAANVEAAGRLALAFYHELLDKKEPLGLALMEARQTVSKELKPDYPNCEWANFILYGDPSLTIRV